MTEKVQKLNLEFLDVTDGHVEKLLDRCDKIIEFGLQDTSVTNKAVSKIREKLSNSLVFLSLSMNYPSVHYPFIHFTTILELLKEMSKLETFDCFGLILNEEKILKKRFPLLEITHELIWNWDCNGIAFVFFTTPFHDIFLKLTKTPHCTVGRFSKVRGEAKLYMS